jgi:hypothetical protein
MYLLLSVSACAFTGDLSRDRDESDAEFINGRDGEDEPTSILVSSESDDDDKDDDDNELESSSLFADSMTAFKTEFSKLARYA